MPGMPERVKYRKMHRGSRAGLATRGHTVAFGEFGVQAMARAWLEAAEGAGFERQVLLGDARALPGALEGAARELGIQVEVTRPIVRVEPPTGSPTGSPTG